MQIEKCAIEGLAVITPQVFGDERGYFLESFQDGRYREVTGGADFVQDNLSHSQKGVLRGLHFQRAPHMQGKLVGAVQGSLFDVAVDIRPESPTFGQWYGLSLHAPRRVGEQWEWTQFWIPGGFAHGFVALEDDTIFSYKCTDTYHPESDAGVMWNDPEINISWPGEKDSFIISPKDQNHPTLKELEKLL